MMLITKYKKGEMPWFMILMVVAVAMGILVLVITSIRAIAGNELVGGIIGDKPVELCFTDLEDTLGENYNK